jgi:hypothetical protein
MDGGRDPALEPAVNGYIAFESGAKGVFLGGSKKTPTNIKMEARSPNKPLCSRPFVATEVSINARGDRWRSWAAPGGWSSTTLVMDEILRQGSGRGHIMQEPHSGR